MRFSCSLVLVLVTLLAACTRPTFDAAAESERLLARDAEWARLASEGKDVEKTLSYWADDAIVVPQGRPTLEGKAAIREFVRTSFATPGFNITWQSQKPVFSPDGKLAYMHSTNVTTVAGPDGALLTFPGRALTIWRLDPDGQWRCVVDIWNDPPRAPA